MKLSRTITTAALLGVLVAACGRAGAEGGAVADEAGPALGGDWRDPMYEKPSDDVLRERLDPMQYKVTQQEGTEPAFRNAFWDNHEAGLYVDVVSGEPLFASTEKYESGTGWPSFWAPVDAANIVEKQDRKLFMVRTEVRSKHGDSHLGHVFPDGPAPTGMRYCINSAALRFIPVDRLEEEGYGEYLSHFDGAAGSGK